MLDKAKQNVISPFSEVGFQNVIFAVVEENPKEKNWGWGQTARDIV